ncbi:MAG: hypothetical protein A2033_01540 [Bacteroidetes bacterium GWA2_31_9]|nr:MAG: hypothetical protein A2033_01540 [Bacteroidetes bacterium GWA2_31_9]
MKKNIKYLLIIGIISLPGFLFGQTTQHALKSADNLSENNLKQNSVQHISDFERIEENGKTVVKFQITPIESEEIKADIINKLLNDTKVHQVGINNYFNCKLLVDNDVSKDYLQELFNSFNVIILSETSSNIRNYEQNGNIVKNKEVALPATYPKREKYLENEKGEVEYKNACQSWRKENQKEWMEYIKSK